MELLYIWIDKYKSISNQGFNLSPKYNFSYDHKQDKLDFKTVEDLLPADFWGENILNLTLILGKNGAGKTSILEYLDQPYLKDGIFVFKDHSNENKKITVYHSGKHAIEHRPKAFEYKRLDQNTNGINEEKHQNYFEGITKIFYTPIFRGDTAGIFDMKYYFRPSDSTYNISKGKSIGKKNSSSVDISSDCELYDTLWYMKQSSSSNNPFYLYNVKQTIYHIWFLADQKFSDIHNDIFKKSLPNLEISPKTVDLSPTFFKKDDFKKLSSFLVYLEESIEKHPTSYQQVFKGKCLLALIKEFLMHTHDKKNQLEKFVELNIEDLKIEGVYNEATKFLPESEQERLQKIPQILSDFATKFNENIELEGNILILKFDTLKQLKYEPLFDFSRSMATSVNYRWTGLSTGELSLLNLFGRFHNIATTFNYSKTYHILIDEGETTLHPHWQKQYIYWIINCIAKMFPSDSHLQFIITTNNHIISSDVPHSNTIRLVSDHGNTAISKMHTDTFGANVYDLLKDSFFIEGGFMGKFANEKINKTIIWLNDPSREMGDKNSHYKTIQMIGEPILKRKLDEMYDEVTDGESYLKNVRKKIEDLQALEKKLTSGNKSI